MIEPASWLGFQLRLYQSLALGHLATFASPFLDRKCDVGLTARSKKISCNKCSK